MVAFFLNKTKCIATNSHAIHNARLLKSSENKSPIIAFCFQLPDKFSQLKAK